MWRKNDIMTIVVPDLEREEAVSIKADLIKMKSRIAPNAKAGIAIGKQDKFSSLMGKCIKRIEED